MAINSQRIEYIDLAKGFCIVLVVALHTASFVEYEFFNKYDIFRVCRMPLYFFLSGLFFKEYNGFFDFCIKKINKLIVPFISFFIVSSLLLPYILYSIGIPIDDNYLSGNVIYNWIKGSERSMFNGPLWFLVCLFELNIIAYFLLRKNVSIIIGVLLSFAIAFIGYSMGHYSHHNYLYLGTAMSALPFYTIGYVILKSATIIQYTIKGRFMSR